VQAANKTYFIYFTGLPSREYARVTGIFFYILLVIQKYCLNKNIYIADSKNKKEDINRKKFKVSFNTAYRQMINLVE
jgi:hypothetical protein